MNTVAFQSLLNWESWWAGSNGLVLSRLFPWSDRRDRQNDIRGNRQTLYTVVGALLWSLFWSPITCSNAFYLYLWFSHGSSWFNLRRHFGTSADHTVMGEGENCSKCTAHWGKGNVLGTYCLWGKRLGNGRLTINPAHLRVGKLIWKAVFLSKTGMLCPTWGPTWCRTGATQRDNGNH